MISTCRHLNNALRVIAVSLIAVSVATAETVTLTNDMWAVSITPDTNEIVLSRRPSLSPQRERNDPLLLSVAQEAVEVVDLRHDDRRARWRVPARQANVSASLDGASLLLEVEAAVGSEWTWVLAPTVPGVRAYIFPFNEGSYVPANDEDWRDRLTKPREDASLERLSMPFWGVELDDATLTYLIETPYNNMLRRGGYGSGISVGLTHAFTPLEEERRFVVSIHLGEDDPLEPARVYRAFLQERGEFVSFADKVKTVPNAAKLLGAFHAYVWGADLLSRHDISNWRRFAGMIAAGKTPPAAWIKERLSDETRKGVEDSVTDGYFPLYLQRLLAEELSGLLNANDLSKSDSWADVHADTSDGNLPDGRASALLFQAAFPDLVGDPLRWGDGLSLKMIERLAEAGFDRFWLGTDYWDGAKYHPEAVALAAENGLLVGTYDSYHSIHHPDQEDSWPTAQFDLRLFETGAVTRADGTMRGGFQQKGHHLNPIAARPYVEERVSRIMGDVSFNSWFLDADAYGEIEEDYHPDHTTSMAADVEARLDRMRWIAETYDAPMGSERGVAYAAPAMHFAHGMTTPVIGWGDPDLQKDREGQYFLGRWYPGDAPAVFFKVVPLKPVYEKFHYDPRYRLPLYQAVFHDSVVTTHHWGYHSFKFSDQQETVRLTECLYNVPPLVHLNLDEFDKREADLKRYYAFWSPLHREIGDKPLTAFEWLSDDRLV
ncbi:MAG: hypothetical protein O3A46_08965, partial [Candidatus Poribacteria bacterium]|nr:hypothetical protein [Candidatus Poribacteria bacterium]